jgi:hypothetical protein
VCPRYELDLTRDGPRPRLERLRGGAAIVRAYTDLKRHNLCDPESHPDPIRFFCNEQLAQGRPDQDGRPGAEFFLTRKLWDQLRALRSSRRSDDASRGHSRARRRGAPRACEHSDKNVGGPGSPHAMARSRLSTATDGIGVRSYAGLRRQPLPSRLHILPNASK